MSAPKISLALGGSKKPPPTNGVKRSHAVALRDPDHEDDDQHHGKAQTVSHFDRSAGGAIDERRVVEKKGPMVIESRKNRDWKEASQRNKRMRYAQVADGEREGRDVEVDVKAVEGGKPGYGLNVSKRGDEEGGNVVMNGDGNGELDKMEQNGEGGEHTNGKTVEETPQLPRTADEEAMDALLGNAKRSTLVLPAMSEEQAFERDVKDAPGMASLADYDRVPVEEFGAAMLRGMGWKDGEGIGANRGRKAEVTKMPVRRPALLGIGAKEEAAVAQELGTWGKAAKGKNGEIKVYNPVLLRDKRTGEMFTEEEAERRKAEAEKAKYEVEFEEKERRRREKDQAREKENSRDGKDRGKRESSRERRDRKDRERERRRHEDSDEEYYRRKKEKERRRRERDDGDRDSDRRKHESDREKRKDRDRRH